MRGHGMQRSSARSQLLVLQEMISIPVLLLVNSTPIFQMAMLLAGSGRRNNNNLPDRSNL